MLSRHFKSRGIVLFSSAAVLSMAVGLSACSDSDDDKAVTSVEFTSTPAPSSNADLVRATTSSTAIVTYDDGSTEEFPLSYNTLFKNVDRVGSSANEAGRLYDYQGSPLVDPNGDAVIAETADANSLLKVDDKLFLVNHWEYDWILADGQTAYKVPNWYSRMPMSMVLTDIAQDDESGKLTATDQRPLDFSGVDGLWIPCFGSQSPWGTHIGSEEDYDLYFVKADGSYGTSTSNGLKALTEIYFKNSRQANPYHYGYIPEVKVNSDGSTEIKKHYNMGRGTWEQALFMPDSRTAYFGDDGTNVFMAMFVGDVAADPSAGGTLYAAKWTQTSDANGGAANLSWVRLGHATSAEVKALIDSGITFWDIFDITTADATPDWAAQGYKAIRAGQSSTEYLRLKAGMEQAAAFLEPRRYAAYLGATTEFNKMEGVAVNRADKKLYMAMSYIDKGMKADATGPVDHIQVAKINAGGTYEIQMASGQTDTGGNAINSEWVGVSMHIPSALLGEDITADALGNTANPNKVANPDNVFFSEKMRTLFIGEDSGTHVNNFVWAYNVDSGKLSRILSLPSGSEATGLQVVDNVNGHAYIMSNNQHQGEWLSSMPASVKDALIAEAVAQHGVNAHGTPNYYLQSHVGYIGGIPGL